MRRFRLLTPAPARGPYPRRDRAGTEPRGEARTDLHASAHSLDNPHHIGPLLAHAHELDDADRTLTVSNAVSTTSVSARKRRRPAFTSPRGSMLHARCRSSPSNAAKHGTIAAVAIAFVVAFIALNRDETRISFIVFEKRTALWNALTLAAASGFVAGFLIGRRHYRH